MPSRVFNRLAPRDIRHAAVKRVRGRRAFVGSSLAALTLSTFSSRVRAGTGGTSRRFLFVHAQGGWDPLCVFAPMFDAPSIEMEPLAEPWSIGNFELVDHPERPNARRFFEERHRDVLLLNGISTRSVNHETCQVVALTGGTSDERPDWGTLLAVPRADDLPLPHIVVSGPSFSGEYSVLVSRAQGLLQPVIDGTVLYGGDHPLVPMDDGAATRVDAYLQRRAQLYAEQYVGNKRAQDYAEAQARGRLLQSAAMEVDLAGGETLLQRANTAIDALAHDLCRCASIATEFVWDTHADNSLQSALFDGFFAELGDILTLLQDTRDAQGQALSESTVVVVTSEMARTPAFNASGGRDHWPYTSMMLLGPGLETGRTIGGYSNLYTGIGVDDAGDLDHARPGITSGRLGATLLELGGIDPQEHLPSTAAIRGILT